MVLAYRKVGSLLYGWIAFFKQEYPGQKEVTNRNRESSPFVIGRYLPDGQLEIYGSVTFLLADLQRLIEKFVETNNRWHAEPTAMSDAQEQESIDRRYDQEAMDFLRLASVHMRELFQLLGRFNSRTIPRLDYQGNADGGTLNLKKLLDVLAHGRYYFFDGAHVRDLFSYREAPSDQFMGYRFDLVDFIEGVQEIINDVSIKDLAQVIRRQFKRLSPESKNSDIVSTVQDVHAFSDLMQRKISEREYQFMTRLMFNDEDLKKHAKESPGRREKTVTMYMKSPSINIASNLEDKEFQIRVQRAIVGGRSKAQPKSLETHKVNVRADDLCDMVNEAFGQDKVLQVITGMPRTYVGRPSPSL